MSLHKEQARAEQYAGEHLRHGVVFALVKREDVLALIESLHERENDDETPDDADLRAAAVLAGMGNHLQKWGNQLAGLHPADTTNPNAGKLGES